MFCPKCGTELIEDSSFCRSCGASIPAAGPDSASVAESPHFAKKRKRVVLVIGVVVLIAVIACSIAYFVSTSAQKRPGAFDLSASISIESSSPRGFFDFADVGISADDSNFSINVVRTGSFGKVLGLDDGDSLTIQGASSHVEESSGDSYSLHAESFGGTIDTRDSIELQKQFNDSGVTLALPSSAFSSSFPTGRWSIQASGVSYFADFDDSNGFSVGEIGVNGAEITLLNGTWEHGTTDHSLKLSLPEVDYFPPLLIDVEFSF